MTDHTPKDTVQDPACEVAHGSQPADDVPTDRVLVAVYASPMASCLVRWGEELGFRTVLLDPDGVPEDVVLGAATTVFTDPSSVEVDGTADVVVTDHHREDLGEMMAPLVRARPRWMGILGSARHTGPHVAALRAARVDDELIATVRRPVGVDIGSKTPPEIALAVLAGLLADRNGRDAGLPPRPTLEVPA